MRPDKIVTIHQPQYLPYVGTIAKIVSAGIFVSYDTADYQKNYFDNRNRVMTKSGPVWLTIPVHAKLGQPIKDVTVAGMQWKRKHLRTVQQLYGRSKFFDRLFAGFVSALMIESERLVDYAHSTLDWILGNLGFFPNKLRSSEMCLTSKSAQEKLVEMTRKAGGSAYLAGPSWRAYMANIDAFQRAGITFLESDIHQVAYDSLAVYAENMSVIDLLFSYGPASADFVRSSITVREVKRA